MKVVLIPGASTTRFRYKYASGWRSKPLGIREIPHRKAYPDPPEVVSRSSIEFMKVATIFPEAREVVVVHYNPFDPLSDHVAGCLLFEEFKSRPSRVKVIGEGLGEIVMNRARADGRVREFARNLDFTSSSWGRSYGGR